MKKRVSDQFWFPFWVDKWIFGSMRIECTLEERAIWIDLLAFASKDEGYIRANEETPYLIQQLVGMLLIPEDKLKPAIKKFIKLGKLEEPIPGIYRITTWEKYQLSESYERVQKHRKKKKEKKTLQCNENGVTILNKNKLKHNTLNNNKEEQRPNITFAEEVEITTELKTVKGVGEKKRNEIILYLRELSIEFPDIDYVYQMKKKCAWWRDNPLNKKSNIHLQLRNWFIIAQKGFTEARSQKQVGAPRGKYETKYPMLFLGNVYKLLREQGKDNPKYSKLLFSLTDEEAKQAAIKYNDSPADFIKFLEEK